MRYTLDKDNFGHAMVWDSPLEMVKDTERDTKAHNWRNYVTVDFPGRKARSWEEVGKFLGTPWPEGAELVNKIAEGIKSSKIAKPTSIKRKRTWDAEDGDLDVDRLLNQEEAPFRLSKRRRVHSPTTITLLNNIDAPYGLGVNSTGVYFRSAVCIAVADFLEEAGYGVEIWQWCLGHRVYPDPYHWQFSACRPKKAGSPLDVHALCDTMSAWFCTNVYFGSFACCPTQPRSIGCARMATEKETDWRKQPVAPWVGHMDLLTGTQIIQIPRLQGSGSTNEERLQDGIEKGVRIAQLALNAVEGPRD